MKILDWHNPLNLKQVAAKGNHVISTHVAFNVSKWCWCTHQSANQLTIKSIFNNNLQFGQHKTHYNLLVFHLSQQWTELANLHAPSSVPCHASHGPQRSANSLHTHFCTSMCVNISGRKFVARRHFRFAFWGGSFSGSSDIQQAKFTPLPTVQGVCTVVFSTCHIGYVVVQRCLTTALNVIAVQQLEGVILLAELPTSIHSYKHIF